jgi:hypothetical protein
MTDLTFLPWLRRGLATALGEPDPLSGALPAAPALQAYVDVAGEQVTRAVHIHGPGAVSGLAAGEVVRCEPRPDSAEVEPSLFPFIELATPDLPWLFTPAQPTAEGQLRPWLVLAVVREQEGVSLEVRRDAPPLLHIDPPASAGAELPDLEDSWAWAHVQAGVPAGDVADAVAAGDRDVVARLVCPRRLDPDCAWLACIVAAFGADLSPAWARDAPSVALPVLHHWRFTTGRAGDFEALCRRLKPDETEATLGLHPMEAGDPGLVTPAGRSVLVDYQGALQSLDAVPRPWDERHKEDFQREVVDLAGQGISRGEVTAEDPVVAPPAYGSGPAAVPAIPAQGWLRSVNDHPGRRAAAGLGARAVRANQEALVAAAWEQAGDLSAAVTALNRGRLAVEIGRSWTRRTAALDDADALQLTARIQPFLRSGDTSVRARLHDSAVPDGMISAAYARVSRPGTALARAWRRRASGAGRRLARAHTATTVAATAPGSADTEALTFAALGRLAGAMATDPTLTGFTEAAPQARVAPAPVQPFPIELPDVDVSGLARTVRAELDPLAPVRANLLLRAPALAALLPPEGLPTSVAVGPSFPDPLCWDVIALGARWLLPGAGELGRNRVRLLETESSIVGSILIGANHELGRELRWRGYPVDLRATFFHRFWQYADAGRTDIDDLAGWTGKDGIRENMGDAAPAMTVIVVRGDLVRRHPTAHYFLQQARFGAKGVIEPVEGKVSEPVLFGKLDGETAFYGFAQSPDAVRGDRPAGVPGWFVGIEEQPHGPRFGLDPPATKYGGRPTTWDDAAWSHLAGSEADLALLTHASAGKGALKGLALDGATWGRNSADMARACWQRPFRMLIHADTLV